MPDTISFFVPGPPGAKPRPRTVAARGGRPHTYTPRARGQDALELAIPRVRPKEPIEGPVKLNVSATKKGLTIEIVPLKAGDYWEGGPDLDNIVKLVMDCCQSKRDRRTGLIAPGIFKNDNQVVWVEAKKEVTE